MQNASDNNFFSGDEVLSIVKRYASKLRDVFVYLESEASDIETDFVYQLENELKKEYSHAELIEKLEDIHSNFDNMYFQLPEPRSVSI